VPRNEDGEFELILGNRQMMSVFFIVVLLFGVIFAIGYILGTNRGPAAEVASVRRPEKAVVVPSPGRDPNPAPAADAPPPPAPEPNRQDEKKTEPAKKAEPKPEPPKQEIAKVEKPKPEPTKAEIKKAEKAAKVASDAPANGALYLQLFATSKDESELLVETLRKKGFKAISSQHPENKTMYRVLVGPVAENTINKTRSDLKAAGFPGDKAIKRSF
jgi:cell division septation protein DedD